MLGARLGRSFPSWNSMRELNLKWRHQVIENTGILGADGSPMMGQVFA